MKEMSGIERHNMNHLEMLYQKVYCRFQRPNTRVYCMWHYAKRYDTQRQTKKDHTHTRKKTHIQFEMDQMKWNDVIWRMLKKIMKLYVRIIMIIRNDKECMIGMGKCFKNKGDDGRNTTTLRWEELWREGERESAPKENRMKM